MAGIYGPVEVKMQKVLIDKASVECYYRPKSGAPGKIENQSVSSMLRYILHFRCWRQAL